MFNLVLLVLLIGGAYVFIKGYRQYKNPDILNIPMVSPLAKQIFGGAAVIASVVIFVMSYRSPDAPPSQRRMR
jgi:hypothetical protein